MIRKACDVPLMPAAGCTLLGRSEPAPRRRFKGDHPHRRCRESGTCRPPEHDVRGHRRRACTSKDYQALVTRGSALRAEAQRRWWKAAATRTPAENACYFSSSGAADLPVPPDHASVPAVGMESIA